jgi:4-hydroxybenzoate polyprenyltransferase
MVGLLLGLFWAAQPYLGMIYLGGVACVALLLLYEHWLVRPEDLSRVNQAFFHVNAIVSIGIFAVVIIQLALPI